MGQGVAIPGHSLGNTSAILSFIIVLLALLVKAQVKR